MASKTTITLIGPFNDIGGVQTHLLRLVQLLSKEYSFLFIDESHNFNKKYCSLRKLNLNCYFKNLFKSDVVHIHSGVWWLRIIHIFLASILSKKIFVTLHSWKNTESSIAFFTTKLTLKLCSKIIIVNKNIAQSLNLNNYIVKYAFLPPIIDNEVSIPKKYDNYFSDNSFKIVANAFRLKKHKNEDLYGLDLCVQLAMKFKQNNDDFKIIFVIGDLDNSEKNLYNKSIELIKKNGIDKYIKIIPHKISFVNAIIKSDLVLRPTNTDGDAITVREALYLKKPIIASDVVERPKGTIVFKNRDIIDLYEKILYVKNNYLEIRQLLKHEQKSDDEKYFYKNLYLN